MMDQVLNILLAGINAVWNWFGVITSHITGAIGLWTGMLIVFFSYRFLLRPLLAGGGVGSSDRVKKSKSSAQEK